MQYLVYFQSILGIVALLCPFIIVGCIIVFVLRTGKSLFENDKQDHQDQDL